MANQRLQSGVFISYSHKDKKWLEYLQVALAPLMHEEKIDLWDDTKIKPGAKWKDEIFSAIRRARVAILLVSPDFLASKFITSYELPFILERQLGGLVVFWIPVRESLYERSDLRWIQAAHDTSKPLASLSPAERDRAFVQIAEKIATAVDINAVANALSIIDDFYPQLDAFVNDIPEPLREPSFSVRARQDGETVTFTSPNHSFPLEVIKAEDISRLDSGARKLIRAYERTMEDLFDRWVELKPKRISMDPEIKKEAIEESEELRRDLCRELRELLKFIESMGKHLHDHYHHIFHVCSQNRQ